MQRDKNLLEVAIIQSELEWESTSVNFKNFYNEISKLKKSVDLVVLPETFSTGFSMNVNHCADRDGSSLKWMKDTSKEFKVFIAGSLIIEEAGKIYNRLYVVGPEDEVDYYDKRHLFRMGREQEFFQHGLRRKIVKIGQFRILLQICYDLRFPVFSRNIGDYDLILYVANWPTARAFVWESLLPARAIENQAYVIGANRCGIDGLGEGTCGNSCIIDAKGNIKARLKDQPGILSFSLDYQELLSFREKFPVLKDGDNFQILY